MFVLLDGLEADEVHAALATVVASVEPVPVRVHQLELNFTKHFVMMTVSKKLECFTHKNGLAFRNGHPKYLFERSTIPEDLATKASSCDRRNVRYLVDSILKVIRMVYIVKGAQYY